MKAIWKGRISFGLANIPVRIFSPVKSSNIGFLQNRKGQTIAAPYSVRPRPLATVSAPLHWHEVNHELSPQMFTIKNMARRLEKEGDIWAPVLKGGVNLNEVLWKMENTD